MRFSKRLNLIPFKYHFNDLEIRPQAMNLPHYLHPSFYSRSGRTVLPFGRSSSQITTAGIFDQVITETGYYYQHETMRNDSYFDEHENTRLLRRTDEIRDLIEEANIRSNNELRKIAVELQTELEDVKRRLTPRQ
jgi:hypothetical protein